MARSGRTWVNVFRGAGRERLAGSWAARGPGGRPKDALGDRPDRRRSSWLAPGCFLIGYVTVAPTGGTCEAERLDAAIAAKCERFAWNLLEIVHDREQGRIRERPGMRYALERIVERRADGLVVGDLRGLSRSIVDLGAFLAWLRDALRDADRPRPGYRHLDAPRRPAGGDLDRSRYLRARADRQPHARRTGPAADQMQRQGPAGRSAIARQLMGLLAAMRSGDDAAGDSR